jgi:hypothetical protein
MTNETEVKPRRGPRPRSVEDEWFDIFMTWQPADQAAAIRMLAQIQRQQKRWKLEPVKAAIGEEAQS